MAKKLNLKKAKAAATSGQNSSIIIIMVLATLAVSFSVVFSRVWYKDISFTNKVIAKKSAVNAVLEQNVAVLDDLQTNFGFLEKDGPSPEDIFKALPLNPDYPGLSSQLETMAALAGARLEAVILALPAEGGVASANPVQFQATVVGGYQNLQNFLRNMETNKRPIRVDKANFNGSEPDLTLQINFTTYYQPVSALDNEKETLTDEN